MLSYNCDQMQYIWNYVHIWNVKIFINHIIGGSNVMLQLIESSLMSKIN